MELSKEFSALTFAALYSKLAKETEYHPLLEERLDALGFTLDFLSDAVETYVGYFTAFSEYDDYNADLPLQTVDPRHTEMAAWIIAGLCNVGSSRDLQIKWRSEIAVLREEKGIGRVKPFCEFLPVIQGWCLARPQLVQPDDRALVFARSLDDSGIEAAYRGLVEHLILLDSLGERRSELSTTSLMWRLSGLLEALIGDKDGGRHGNPFEKAARVFYSQYQHLLNPKPNLTGWKDWKSVGKYRNTLTHIRAEDSLTFKDAAVVHTEKEWWENLLDLAVKSTHFIGAYIAEEMASDWAPRGFDWLELKATLDACY